MVLLFCFFCVLIIVIVTEYKPLAKFIFSRLWIWVFHCIALFMFRQYHDHSILTERIFYSYIIFNFIARIVYLSITITTNTNAFIHSYWKKALEEQIITWTHKEFTRTVKAWIKHITTEERNYPRKTTIIYNTYKRIYIYCMVPFTIFLVVLIQNSLYYHLVINPSGRITGYIIMSFTILWILLTVLAIFFIGGYFISRSLETEDKISENI